MGTRRDVVRLDRAALVVCTLIALTAVGWLAGWPWLAAPAAMAILGVAAYAVGADSREPGDWRR